MHDVSIGAAVVGERAYLRTKRHCMTSEEIKPVAISYHIIHTVMHGKSENLTEKSTISMSIEHCTMT